MFPSDGVPWQPPPLDEYLEEPFDQIEQQQKHRYLERLDDMVRRLDRMEEELNAMLVEFAHYP